MDNKAELQVHLMHEHFDGNGDSHDIAVLGYFTEATLSMYHDDLHINDAPKRIAHSHIGQPVSSFPYTIQFTNLDGSLSNKIPQRSFPEFRTVREMVDLDSTVEVIIVHADGSKTHYAKNIQEDKN